VVKAIPAWKVTGDSIQLGHWRERAQRFRELWEASEAQAHAYRRQLIDAGLEPVELNPHEGPLSPAAIKKPAKAPTFNLTPGMGETPS
jgi:sugar phosphate isomerase/epimerase